MHAESDLKRERLLWLATFVLAALPLLGWWLYGLFDLDEGFYAAVTREMLRSGDWITPHFNGKPWFEKPILLYWAAAPCVALLGDAVGPRLPSVLANLGLYAMIGAFVARRISPASGRWAVLILGTSPLVAALGKMMMTDALFVFFLSASFLALYRSFADGWKWRLLAGAMLGFGVLAKGPVAFVLLALLMAVLAWQQSDLRPRLFDLRANFAGFGALVVVVCLWYLPAYLASGEVFVQKFLIEQNVGRFAGGDKAHAVPWYLHLPYYPLVLGLGMFPWSWRIVEGWPRKAQADEPGAQLAEFCAHWFLVVLIFFTISGSKLPHYIFPAAVPLAILLSRTLQKPLFGLGTMVWGLVLAVALGYAGIEYYARSGQGEAHALARWLATQPEPVAAYQIPRRQKSLGTGKPKLQETSLPSLAFYMNKSYVEVENINDLIPKAPILIFTRTGRMTGLEHVRLLRVRYELERVSTPVPQANYEVYRLRKR